MKRGVAKARRLWEDGQVQRALAEVEQLLEAWPDNPRLLIMRAELVQLQEEVEGLPSLDDLRSDLARAASLDEDAPAALIELGYHDFVHGDDPKRALKSFDKAVLLAVDLLTQALVGQSEALSELQQKEKAFRSLMTACGLVAQYGSAVRDPVVDRIQELIANNLEAGAASGNGSHD